MLRRIVAFWCALGGALAQPGDPSAADRVGRLSIEQLMDVRVETASLRKQSLRDAPSDVSVITAADIRRFGYRTLGELLSNVRGFYSTFDGGFQFSGVRGFSLLGDYNTRFLVMINGHHMTDNVYSAMYMFGQDFGLDMDLIEQVEVVRGPSSALYGSNGVFATVNIITKIPADSPKQRVSFEGGSFGEAKTIASSTFALPGGGTGLFAGSVFRTRGRAADVATGDDPEQLVPLDDVGREQGFHSFAHLAWSRWNLVALFNERRVAVPTSFYSADLGDLGTRSLEGRNFVELSWRRPIGQSGAIKWRTYYDQYRYDGIYNYLRESSYQNVDGAIGDWVGSQFLYQQEHSRLGSITLGAETNIDIRNVQYNYDLSPLEGGPARTDNFRLRHPNAAVAGFVQNEWNPAPNWTFYAGVRFDESRNNQALWSPRAAAVYRRNNATYKLNYGRAFRNPSTFERYYTPNPLLEAERIHSVELSREQKAGRFTVLTSGFHYKLDGLIQGVPVDENSLQYRNTSKASATGFEAELRGRPMEWLDMSVAYTAQRVRGEDANQRPENSPAHLAYLRAGVPLAQERILIGGAVRYVGSRLAADKSTVAGATVVDLTFTARPRNLGLDLQFGIRNLADTRYADPLSPEHGVLLLPRAGRSVYVKLTWGGLQ